jgi:hypothetical protein
MKPTFFLLKKVVKHLSIFTVFLNLVTRVFTNNKEEVAIQLALCASSSTLNSLGCEGFNS